MKPRLDRIAMMFQTSINLKPDDNLIGNECVDLQVNTLVANQILQPSQIAMMFQTAFKSVQPNSDYNLIGYKGVDLT